MDVGKIRDDFPILKSGVIYLDSAASSLTPDPVLEKMMEFYHGYRANVQRGIHKFSQKASEEYEEAYRKVAKFVNAEQESEIVMTKNTTEGINLIAGGLDWRPKDKVVTSIIEHHSNFVVWLRTRVKHEVEVEVVNPSVPEEEGFLNPDDFERAIDDHTKLVALTHISNVLGTIEPIKEITDIAHEHGAYVLVDGAQSVPHIEVDVQKVGCDFLAFSGHKMCGPTGSGGLYIREELCGEVEPTYVGGGAIMDVDIDGFKLFENSKKFLAGTPAISDVIGLGSAVDYLQNIGMANIELYERELAKQIYEGLKTIPQVEVYGPKPEGRIALVSFNIESLNPHDVALMLDGENIFVRSGHHCAIPLNKTIIRRNGTVRVSAYFYNTREEVDRFLSALLKVAIR